ncbi:hypothetical protein [Aurantiacibacter gangjinensis]|uniref:hypothetical protein n=1 Tax=Aurantiacibacter gangjinensis TaxID=502682 RepID=UPI00069C4361|nr:hypothetical protein [Aurantiacibacter gangjinensis]APE29261.1 hypothetical protein BMF35_b0006 [Aurantiacibacter gangjinensis]
MTNPLDWWTSLGRPLARLPRWAAVAVLAALVAAMAWSTFAVAPVDQAETAQVEARGEASEGDLALYRTISQRVADGEPYYGAAMDEQRARNYPTRPFVAVRLPTLAMLHSAIGVDGVRYLSVALLLACLWGLHQRLSGTVSDRERIAALIMLALGGAAVAAPQAGLVHEVLAGMLLTLAFLFYTPERWWPSLLAAGAAIAVREIAVSFVLLWLAFAVTGRRWREAGALVGLLALFAAMMGLHYHLVEMRRMAGDPASQGWDAMTGYALPLMALSRLTAFLVLPVTIAAPLAILPFVGWLGLGGRIGLFAALWFAGFFTAMALFARPENFYWAQLVLPAYVAGLAFVPRALGELLRNSLGRSERQS